MGSVHLSILSVETVDRQTRYSWAGWTAAERGSRLSSEVIEKKLLDFRKEFQERSPETKKMLEAIGDPNSLNRFYPVLYPRAAPQMPTEPDGIPSEEELFLWFQNNDDRNQQNRQYLHADLTTNGKLHPLEPNDKPARQGRP